MAKRNPFRKQLCSLATTLPSPADLQSRSDELMQAFLLFGSETEDNLSCVQHVEYGWVNKRDFGPPSICGLKLHDKPLLISDLIYALGGYDLLPLIRQNYPDLTEEEWDATLRITTIILLSFEHNRRRRRH